MSYELSAMNEDHLQELLTNVWQKTGYDFREYRRQTIERRIARRIALLNVTDIPAYRALLERNPEEYWHLIGELTIKVSRLFRNPYVFEFMDQAIWPELLRPPGADKHLRIWSAGCAYGEETYSLAISILDHMERKKIPLKGYEITIIGTDIDEEALMLARAGQYDSTSVGEVKKRLLDRYFYYESNPPIPPLTKGGKEGLLKGGASAKFLFGKGGHPLYPPSEKGSPYIPPLGKGSPYIPPLGKGDTGGFSGETGYYTVVTRVKEMITFAVHDLTSPTIMSPPPGVVTNYDLIFCRNLLIYFAPALQERVLFKLLRVLNPGGYLILGESETLPPQMADSLQVFDKRANIYQKVK
ncbi:MAG: protein-glutamate O-methyltransferase CheR [Thermodesulfobacteriota bacterium]